jgi:hypothetical protein
MTATLSPPVDVSAALNSVVGLECWFVNTGVFGGSCSLSLGDRVRRREPLKNVEHPPEFREFEGEATLFVWCPWRLDGTDEPLTSSDDGYDKLRHEMEALTGSTVVQAETSHPAWDLTLTFSCGKTLRVFCNFVPGEPSWDGNWDLAFTEWALSVGPGAKTLIEPR